MSFFSSTQIYRDHAEAVKKQGELRAEVVRLERQLNDARIDLEMQKKLLQIEKDLSGYRLGLIEKHELRVSSLVQQREALSRENAHLKSQLEQRRPSNGEARLECIEAAIAYLLSHHRA